MKISRCDDEISGARHWRDKQYADKQRWHDLRYDFNKINEQALCSGRYMTWCFRQPRREWEKAVTTDKAREGQHNMMIRLIIKC
jgi:hypothetical protein